MKVYFWGFFIHMSILIKFLHFLSPLRPTQILYMHTHLFVTFSLGFKIREYDSNLKLGSYILKSMYSFIPYIKNS